VQAVVIRKLEQNCSAGIAITATTSSVSTVKGRQKSIRETTIEIGAVFTADYGWALTTVNVGRIVVVCTVFVLTADAARKTIRLSRCRMSSSDCR
jgi:ABC-type arginine transport system ATPase subunit